MAVSLLAVALPNTTRQNLRQDRDKRQTPGAVASRPSREVSREAQRASACQGTKPSKLCGVLQFVIALEPLVFGPGCATIQSAQPIRERLRGALR